MEKQKVREELYLRNEKKIEDLIIVKDVEMNPYAEMLKDVFPMENQSDDRHIEIFESPIQGNDFF